LALSIASFTLIGQPVGDRRPLLGDLLRNAGLRVAVDSARARASREVQLRWTQAATGNGLRVVRLTDRNEPPPRQRSPEISDDQIAIVALDAQGVVRWWRIVTDPRLVRGEFPDAGGNLRRTVFYRADADLEISIPDTMAAAEVRILAPSRDTDGSTRLATLATVALGAAQ
jgi:hypothetical protein